MTFLKVRAENHGFFQCSHCRKIDELAILKSADGKRTLLLIPKEWEEVLDESVEGLIHQFQDSAKDLSSWRDGKPIALETLQSAISGWKEFQHIIYYFPLDHPGEALAKFPWQFTFIEADRELAASRSLAALGFYKDAFKALRSYLELILFGLFIFSRNDQQYFQEWFAGTKQAPPITGKTGLIRLVCENEYLSEVDKQADWATQLTDGYRRLSNFVHSRGRNASNLWLWQQARPKFNEKAWSEWIEFAVTTVHLMSAAVVCHFPRSLFPVEYFEKFGFDGPAGLFLDHEQVQVIRSSFSNSPLLKALDETVRTAAEFQKENSGVERLPDLTADAIRETLDRFMCSLKTPTQRQQVKGALEDERFREFTTVQWSIVLNMQRGFVRDASLALIAQKLELLQAELPEQESMPESLS
jgi:hypothetical protein